VERKCEGLIVNSEIGENDELLRVKWYESEIELSLPVDRPKSKRSMGQKDADVIDTRIYVLAG